MTEKVQVENTIDLGKQLRRVEVGERENIFENLIAVKCISKVIACYMVSTMF